MNGALKFVAFLILAFGTAEGFAEATVRLARARDFQEISQLSTVPPGPAWTPSQVEGVQKSGRTFLVLVQDFRVIGFAALETKKDSFVVEPFILHPDADAAQAAADLSRHLFTNVIDKKHPKVAVTLPLSAHKVATALAAHSFTVSGSEGGDVTLVHDHTHRWRFKPGELREKNFYQRLGLPETASRRDVQEAHRLRVAVNAGDPATVKLLDEAFATLDAPLLKRKYDEAIPRFPLLLDTPQGPASAEAGEAPFTRAFDFHSPNLYERLGVPANSTLAKIKEAYFVRSLTIGDSKELDLFQEAFRVLSHPSLRREYDRAVQEPNERIRSVKIAALIKTANDNKEARYRSDQRPTKQTSDLYDILRVSRRADPRQIQDALGFILVNAKTAQERVDAIKAHEVLNDPFLRDYFDEQAKVMTAEELERLVDQIHEDPKSFRAKVRKTFIPKENILLEVVEKPRDLYVVLGVDSKASAEEVEARYSAAMRKSLTNEERVEITHAFEILSHRISRKNYDSLREEKPYSEDALAMRREINRQLNALRVLKTLEADGPRETMVSFLESTQGDLSLIGNDPGLAREYVKALKRKLPRLAQETEPTLAVEMVITRLGKVAEHYPRSGGHETLLGEILQLRQALVTDTIRLPHIPFGQRQEVLGRYLHHHPPDFLSRQLREWRDAAAPEVGCAKHFSDL